MIAFLAFAIDVALRDTEGGTVAPLSLGLRDVAEYAAYAKYIRGFAVCVAETVDVAGIRVDDWRPIVIARGEARRLDFGAGRLKLQDE